MSASGSVILTVAISTSDYQEMLRKPKVLISGAGVGGLALATLLHKAKVTCIVFERAHEIKPRGKCCIKILTIWAIGTLAI